MRSKLGVNQIIKLLELDTWLLLDYLITILQSKSVDWFLYDKNLRHERVKELPSLTKFIKIYFL